MKRFFTFFVLTFATGLLTYVTPAPAEVTDPRIYWTSYSGGIHRSSLDGSNVETLLSQQDYASSIALDMTAGKIYWGDHEWGKIHRSSLDGSNVETLVTGVRPWCIALDMAAGKIYWGESYGKIMRANLNGKNIETFITNPKYAANKSDPNINLNYRVGDIALDVAGSKIYWTEYGSGNDDGKIKRANLNGSNIKTLISGLVNLDGIALDVAGSKMYWTEYGFEAIIKRANLNGTDIETLILNDTLNVFLGVALDVAGDKIYWTEFAPFGDPPDGWIKRANLNGTDIETLVSGVDDPKGIALSISAFLPHLSTPPTETPRKSAEVVSIPDRNLAAAVREKLGLAPNVPITQQAIQKLTELDARNSQIKNLTGLEHATRLRRLMLRENQIRDITPLANLKSLKELILESNPVSNIRALAGMKQLTGLLLGGHAISDFTPLKNLTELERLSLWGSNISDVTLLAAMTKLRYLWLGDNNISDITPLANLTQLKVLELRDNRIRNINPLVGLKNLEELSVRGNPITDKSPLRTLKNRNPNLKLDIEIPPLSPVVHLEAAQRPPIYWVGAITGTLHRLVGDEVENLVPNVKNATSLAVDMAGGKLYWAEKTSERTGRIRGANLDGTNVKLVKNLTSVPHGIALDTVNGKLYLTNAWGKVQRLNVDGSNFQSNFITGLNTPRNLVLDVTGGKVYWTEELERIQRANLDGSRVEAVVTGLAIPMDIAVFGNTLYWAERMDEHRGEIRSVALTGTPNITTHRSFPESVPLGIAVDGEARMLYWTTSRGDIGRSPLDGSTLQQLVVTGLGTPERLAVQVKAPEIPEILATDALLRIDPSPVTSPGIGEQLTVNLNITAGETVAGYQVTVEFDATALRYVGSHNGAYLPTNAFFVPPVINRGRVELAATALTGVSNGEGTLATITFEVMVVKASTLTVSEPLLADSQGNTFRPRVAGGEVTEPPELTADVNGDSMVNIQDLVLVASSFGKTDQNTADVNGDGVVNIADLVLVAGALGTSAAAPLLYPDALEMLTTADVRQWLSQVHQLDVTEARAQRGIRYLEQLLAVLTPQETILLPNYPNPFNPETWIPYQLTKAGDVKIVIYDAKGVMVRTLLLGHQSAGYYTSRSRAAYWDGRNTQREPVASGVYFYTLTAGDFTATRKMLIRK